MKMKEEQTEHTNVFTDQIVRPKKKQSKGTKYHLLSFWDYLAMLQYCLSEEEVENIRNLRAKLDDLQVLLSKSNLPSKMYKQVKTKKKPTPFEIYTMVQYDYEEVPGIYKKSSKKKWKKGKKYKRLADQYMPYFFGSDSLSSSVFDPDFESSRA